MSNQVSSIRSVFNIGTLRSYLVTFYNVKFINVIEVTLQKVTLYKIEV